MTHAEVIQVQSMIDRAVSEEAARIRAGFPEIFRRLFDSEKRNDDPSRLALLGNYTVFNATSLGRILPHGTIFITDAGTTPSRSIALVYSDGRAHTNLAAVVI